MNNFRYRLSALFKLLLHLYYLWICDRSKLSLKFWWYLLSQHTFGRFQTFFYVWNIDISTVALYFVSGETSFSVIFWLNNCSFIINLFNRVVSSRYLPRLLILKKMWWFNLFLWLKMLKTLRSFWIVFYTFIGTFIICSIICHILCFSIWDTWQVPTLSPAKLVLNERMIWIIFGLRSDDIDSSVILRIVVVLVISTTHIYLNEDLRLSYRNNCWECYVFFV